MSLRLRNLLMTSTALLALGATPGGAQPTGPNVVGGTATVSGTGTNSVIVNQSSSRAIINWNTFNVSTGGSATFNQPGASAITLNRVTGGLGPSMIDGTISANGRVFIINRDGMLFGRNAVINTAGFLASTNDIRNDDFMAGRMNFNIPGRPDASIVNLGTITASSHGFAALVAPGVRNTGTITATLGTVALASGNSFTLDMYGDKLIQLAVGDEIAGKVVDVATGKPLSSLVSNEGRISANGGRVELTAAAARHVVDSVINNRGVIEANSVGTRNGRIVLGGATTRIAGLPKQTIRISGKITATGTEKGSKGGTIQITGEDIQFAAAMLDVSGHSGGGKILVGGDYGGGRPIPGVINNQSAVLEDAAVPTATTVTVDGATTFNASATVSGNGGKVILWSDTLTTFAGTIFARGGDQGGNGGFVEVSGKQQLAYTGAVDTRAPNGEAGTLLLDPDSFNINAAAASTITANLATTPVVILTSAAGTGGNGDITVNAPIIWSSGNGLTLSAYRNIVVSANIANSGSAPVTLRADNSGTGVGTVTSANATVSTAGAVSIFYNPVSYTNAATKSDTSGNPYSSFITGGGNLTAYMLVNNFSNLSGITSNLSGTYALSRDIDAPAIALSGGGTFLGTLDGQGHTIANLRISGPGFATIEQNATVRNLRFTNTTIDVSSPAVSDIGIFGRNFGTIANVSVQGSINISNVPATRSLRLGGLVGHNFGTVVDSISDVSIRASGSGGAGGPASVSFEIGGLVGSNSGLIANSRAAGAINVTDLHGPTFVGGLTGNNDGNIANSRATGNVSTTNGDITAGGLAGSNLGSIGNSFATGNVTANGATQATIGGLAGRNDGTITTSHATGNVSTNAAFAIAGGFVGLNTGAIDLSFANGNVSVGNDSFAGGFVGFNLGAINQAYANGAVTGGANSFVGGFAGANVGVDVSGQPGNNAAALSSGNAGSITQAYALGSTTGGDAAVVASFVALNFGKLDQVYGAGHVQGSAGSTLRGLIGMSSPTIVIPDFGLGSFGSNLPTGTATNAFWDMQTTAIITSAGGTGMNTAVLAGALPPGFDPVIWSHGSYPFLVNLGPQNTTPGPAIIPPVGDDLQKPFLPPPDQQINSNSITTAAAPSGLIPDAGQFVQQQQQRQAQQQQAADRTITGSVNDPIRLDVGENRFFYIPPDGETRIVTDEVVIQLPCDVPVATLDAILKQHNLTVMGSQCLQQGGQAAYRMRHVSSETAASVIRALAEHQVIAAAQANYVYALQEQQVQSATSQQGDPGQYVPEKLRLLALHRLVRGAGIPIAVIDSEIDGAHPDYTGAVADRYDATGVEDEPHPHGTGMAGAIVSQKKLLGVAPGARILAIRAFSARASHTESTTFHILRGLDWAISHDVRIINMSFAGPRDPSLERALKAAYEKGIVLVAAAGNAGPRAPALYPAADPNVIAVTATDVDDRLFSGANRGAYVAISAPGVDILVPAPAGEYQVTTGTSVATAHISGVIALMLERNAKLTPAEVRKILAASAKRLGPSNMFGAGLVDPVRAVEMATPRSAGAPQPGAPRATATAAARQ